MKILLVHNTYQFRGGEDSVVDSEVRLLRDAGHEVIEYRRHNDEIKQMSKVQAATDSLWSRTSADEVRTLVAQHRPDVMHVHNTLPLISPSVFWAARSMGVPSVMTLHNFRLLCPQAMFLREGRLCEDCVGHVPWRAVMHQCYRGSAVQTGVLAASVTLHRMLGTYRHVDRFVALSQFARDKFVSGGLPAERLVVKSNFVEDCAGEVGGASLSRRGGLFVGRLSPEKGIRVLLDAARDWPDGSVEVIGHGPMEEDVRSAGHVVYAGSLPLPTVLQRMAASAFLLVPSICYENFPRTIAEAFCMGLPVIASRLGGMAEIIEDGVTGLLFEPGQRADLSEKVQWAHAHPTEMAAMGKAARRRYERDFSPQSNLMQLEELYRSVQLPRRA